MLMGAIAVWERGHEVTDNGSRGCSRVRAAAAVRPTRPDATGERLKVASILPQHINDGVNESNDNYMGGCSMSERVRERGANAVNFRRPDWLPRLLLRHAWTPQTIANPLVAAQQTGVHTHTQNRCRTLTCKTL
jgi:hypothetical protein